MELTAHDKWISEYDADCSLTDDELLLIKDAWDAATEHAAMTGVEFEEYIQEKWSAGYVEGFRCGKELVIPVGYKLVPIVPTEAMLTAGYDAVMKPELPDEGKELIAVYYNAILDAVGEE